MDEGGMRMIANEVLVKLLDDLFNNKNLAVIDETFSNDCIHKTPFNETVGKEDFKDKFLVPLFNAFPDLQWVSHEVIVDLPTVVNRYTFSGTQKGEYLGQPASNKKLTWTGLSLNRVSDTGRITEVHTFFDRKELFEQMKA